MRTPFNLIRVNSAPRKVQALEEPVTACACIRSERLCVRMLKLTNEEFRNFAALVYEMTGIHLADSKLGLLSNRLRRRLRALQLDSFEAYYRMLQSKADYERELPHFLSAVTTNETFFFRNDGLWRSFVSEVIPELAAAKCDGSRSIRIWSAAGSTGAEACTAAILLRESLCDLESWHVTIIASDISKDALEQAETGIYSDYAVARVSPERLKKWFRKVAQGYKLADEIRRLVQFKYHNLRDPWPEAPFDLVLLRNVLMYFDLDMKKRALTNVSDALAPGGCLLVGDVDPIRTIPELRAHVKLERLWPGAYRRPISEQSASREVQHVVRT